MDNTNHTTEELANVPAPENVVVVNAADVHKEMLLKAMELSEVVPAMQEAITFTPEYLELEKPGESFRGVFIGFQDFQITDQATGEVVKKTAARFVINRKIWINAGAVLVNEIKRAGVPEGTPLKVTYKEKSKNVKLYDITLLA